MQKFIDDTFLQSASDNLKVSIVKEKDAEEFVIKVKNELLEHNK